LDEFILNLIVNSLKPKEEWQAVHFVVNQTPLPSSPPPMSEMLSMIARLGGYLGRKHDGPPGPQSIWIGLQCPLRGDTLLRRVPSYAGDECEISYWFLKR